MCRGVDVSVGFTVLSSVTVVAVSVPRSVSVLALTPVLASELPSELAFLASVLISVAVKAYV